MRKSSAADRRGPRNGWIPNRFRKATAGAMERFPVSWLEHLEARLGEVTKAIANAEANGKPEPLKSDASVFELLRAAA
jgi:hypothetical protein